jgi:fatty acid desaturase
MLRNAFWVLSLFVLGLYAFFVVLGAWDPVDVLPLTIVMVVLAVLWVGHAWFGHRHADEIAHDPQAMRARERRGF